MPKRKHDILNSHVDATLQQQLIEQFHQATTIEESIEKDIKRIGSQANVQPFKRIENKYNSAYNIYQNLKTEDRDNNDYLTTFGEKQYADLFYNSGLNRFSYALQILAHHDQPLNPEYAAKLDVAVKSAYDDMRIALGSYMKLGKNDDARITRDSFNEILSHFGAYLEARGVQIPFASNYPNPVVDAELVRAAGILAGMPITLGPNIDSPQEIDPRFRALMQATSSEVEEDTTPKLGGN